MRPPMLAGPMPRQVSAFTHSAGRRHSSAGAGVALSFLPFSCAWLDRSPEHTKQMLRTKTRMRCFLMMDILDVDAKAAEKHDARAREKCREKNAGVKASRFAHAVSRLWRRALASLSVRETVASHCFFFNNS